MNEQRAPVVADPGTSFLPLAALPDPSNPPNAALPRETLDALADALAPRLAVRLAALLEEAPAAAPPLVDVAEVARVLGVSAAFVYDHADELGAVRLGTGPKARLRFDVEAAKAAHSRSGSEESQPPSARIDTGGEGRPRRRRSARVPDGLPDGLPVAGSVLRSRPEAEPCR